MQEYSPLLCALLLVLRRLDSQAKLLLSARSLDSAFVTAAQRAEEVEPRVSQLEQELQLCQKCNAGSDAQHQHSEGRNG